MQVQMYHIRANRSYESECKHLREKPIVILFSRAPCPQRLAYVLVFLLGPSLIEYILLCLSTYEEKQVRTGKTSSHAVQLYSSLLVGF
jgi:hypothetical protein